ncbi:MFS general substrate transporter [Mytilinidion resinicola]|uniref:MFS general substrate transporter n=1 Tax=Mytilinidion resinicola TaxID=574789 RepID=A0A6A6Z2K9_9PEZI|nr:MFS general substrate transporter [Mytilinidion resinicola]KAF2815351.1 MFS general substrate transporter [Mytilinidion resinicola]
MSSAHSAPSAQEAAKLPPPLQEDDENADSERNFQPKSLKFWVIIGAIYAAIFLVALDRMIIATAIPHITDEFHSIEDIGWYGGAYMLTCAIFNPLSGRVYQLYPTKGVFLISIVIFEVGSTVCGAAPSSIAFIIGRAIAGMGAAGIFSGGIMIMVPMVPLRKRPVFNSFFGMAFGVSSVLGPLVGGSFADSSKLTWRWCFYLNLPIGGFTILAMLLFLHLESPPREKLSIFAQLKLLDPLGLLFFVPSMVCLILACQWGGTTYPWSAPRIIVLLVIFALTFILFLAVEVFTPKTAMAPTRVVLNRSVAGSMLFMFLLSGALMAIVYYLAIWFQAAQGHSAMEAGIRTTPLVLSLVVFGIAAALVTEKLGYYVPVMLCAPLLCAVGAGMLSTLTPRAGSAQWIGYQVIYGMGIGCGFSIANLGPQVALPRADVPLGMALMFFMQQLGGAVFLAVSQNMFSHELVKALDGIAGLDTQAIVNTGATALKNVVPPGELGTVVRAYNYALTRVFILSAGLSASMIVGALMVEWKSVKAEKSREKKEKKEKENKEAGEGKRRASIGEEKSGGTGEKEVSQ